MKSTKLSLFIVLSAALAASAFAQRDQRRSNDGRQSAPSSHSRSYSPSNSSHSTHTFGGSSSRNFGSFNRSYSPVNRSNFGRQEPPRSYNRTESSPFRGSTNRFSSVGSQQPFRTYNRNEGSSTFSRSTTNRFGSLGSQQPFRTYNRNENNSTFSRGSNNRFGALSDQQPFHTFSRTQNNSPINRGTTNRFGSMGNQQAPRTFERSQNGSPFSGTNRFGSLGRQQPPTTFRRNDAFGVGRQQPPTTFRRNDSFGRAPSRQEPPRTFQRNTNFGNAGGFRNQRPPFGNSFNFGGNRRAFDRSYAFDSARSSCLVQNFYGWQSPEWGDHWRYGYCGYPSWGGGFNWGFGFYLYTPFVEACVASPWYYYPCLPPYLPLDRVVVEPGYYCDWNVGVTYEYHPTYASDSYGDGLLNESVNDISAVFQNQDAGAVDSILSDGQVAIFSDGKYEYSVNAGDFHQMMQDNVSAVQTVSFNITSVRREGNTAVVKATHSFNDPNGGTDTVYQMYRLRREGGRYVITDFMTSHGQISERSFF